MNEQMGCVMLLMLLLIIVINITISISINRYNDKRILSRNRFITRLSVQVNNNDNNNLNNNNNEHISIYQLNDINRLGDDDDSLKKLDSILILRSFDYLRSQLLDRICTLEWFNQISEPFFTEKVTEEEMSKFISSLIKLNQEKITVTKSSDSNPDITVDIVQVIEPRLVASILLACRINVIDDMLSQLPLILKENAESAKYAATCLQDGENVARKNRRPVLSSSSSPDSIKTFSSLNMLITNSALNQMKVDLYSQQKKHFVEYLNEFVENVAQSGTLDDLLKRGSKNVRKIAVNFRKWQEGPSAGLAEDDNEMIDSNSKDIYNDVHKPGSPRHLLERLMLQGLASSSFENNMKGTKKRKINNDKDRKEDEDEDVDVQSLAQSLIDSRAFVAESLNEILRSKRERFEEQKKIFTELIEENGGYAKVQVNGLVSPGLEVSKFSYNSPVLQINTTIFDKNFNKTSNETGTDFRVTAGKPPSLPSDASSFGGDEKIGKPGWKAEDGSQTKPDSAGVKKKSLVSVLDPPSKRPPEPPSRNNGGIEVIERPNGVDYFDEDFGNINDFINLGPNTRIRIVGIAEEDNKRFACLEAIGGTLPSGFIFRRWVDYNDAVRFLDLNNNMTDSNENKESDKISKDNINSVTNKQETEENDSLSPFFGGGVIRM